MSSRACVSCVSSVVQAWHLTGDVYAKKPGDKPWISEMYGYSFGAAKAGVRHRSEVESMLYPGYQPVGECVCLGERGWGEWSYCKA
mgnify:CR=1 FL=1